MSDIILDLILAFIGFGGLCCTIDWKKRDNAKLAIFGFAFLVGASVELGKHLVQP